MLINAFLKQFKRKIKGPHANKVDSKKFLKNIMHFSFHPI